MAASMSDVGSVGGDMSGGEESSMDDSSSTGGERGVGATNNFNMLQSPARNGSGGEMLPPSPVSRDQLHKRIDSLHQQNRVLKVELETYKLRVKALQEENRALRQASVHIQAKAEQEEEFISNTLLKKIQELKKEKENLALNYEQEEECLTNDLSRKLDQLRHEKVQLEHTLEQEQECLVNKLMRRIEKLETETTCKQSSLDNLRREKVELENTLEQEQEALVNKLWKRMDQLETEKRTLQRKLEKPESNSPPPRALSLADFDHGGDTAANLANNIRALKCECLRLKKQLASGRQEHERTMAAYAKEEREIREENLRLQRRLQLEMERREALCRHLSESESSLEMEEERVYNEMSHSHQVLPQGLTAAVSHRTRTVSSPVPLATPCSSGLQQPSAVCGASGRPLSPGLNYGERRDLPLPVGGRTDVFTPPSLGRLHHSFNSPPGVSMVASPSPPPPQVAAAARRHVHPERFARPPPVTSPGGTATSSQSQQHVTISGPSSSVFVGQSQALQRVESNEVKPPSSPMDTSDNKS